MEIISKQGLGSNRCENTQNRGCQNWQELATSNNISMFLRNISVKQKYLENKRINTCVVYPAHRLRHKAL